VTYSEKEIGKFVLYISSFTTGNFIIVVCRFFDGSGTFVAIFSMGVIIAVE
jgi:hypothetical protein